MTKDYWSTNAELNESSETRQANGSYTAYVHRLR